MGRKRTYGTGTLMERPAGSGRYRLRVYVGTDPATGKPRQASRTVEASSEKAARTELARFVAQVADEKVYSATSLSRLLDEHLTELRRLGRAPTTLDTYRQHIEAQIKPGVGNVRLDVLSPRDLERFYGRLQADGLAPGTVRKIHAIISGACARAVKWGWIDRNPASLAELPSVPRCEPETPTPDEVRSLIDLADSEGDADLAALVALAAMTGARRGELCGLRWEDVDWDALTVRLERQWVPVKGGAVQTGLKTGEARIVPLGPLAVERLKLYRDQVAERMGVEPAGWLLSYDGGATPMRPPAVSEQVRALGERHQPPIALKTHALRHFFVTYLGGLTDPKTAMRLAGHKNLPMTMRYTRALPERATAAVGALSALVAVEKEGVVDAVVRLPAQPLAEADGRSDHPAGTAEADVARLSVLDGHLTSA